MQIEKSEKINMRIPEISNAYAWINRNLSERKFAAAFYIINHLLKELNDWNAQCKYEELVGIYRNILNFRLSSTEEDDKNPVFNHFLTNLYSLAENVKEQLFIRHSDKFEYSQIRLFASDTRYFIPQEVMKYGNNIYDVLLNHYLSMSVNDMINKKLPEDVEKQLFEKRQMFLSFTFSKIWLSFDNNDEDIESMKNVLGDENIGIDAKCIIISALALNILRIFNTKKLEILLLAVENEKQEVRQRALISIMFVLAKFGHYFNSDEKLKNRFLSFIEENSCINEMENIMFQLIRTSETAGITRHIQEEIFPEFVKMSPMIRGKLKDINDEKEKNEEKNETDWEEFMDENEVNSEKLEEFGEMQMSGSDVYVSSFAQMKSHQFFRPIENWFVPFNSEHPAVKQLFKKKQSLFTLVMTNPALCNSDKYAFSLSLLNMPEAERNAMQKAIKEQKEQMEEMIKEIKTLQTQTEEKIIANHYIQDLYRFYTQHPRHFDFENPLREIANLINKSIFYTIFSNERIRKIAGYFFAYKHYPQALRLYLRIFDHQNPDLELARKIGYCFQKNGQIQDALRFYMIAESVEKNDVWTLKRMAFCYRKTGDFRSAADCYSRILDIKTEDFKLLFSQAMCYVENDNIEGALTLLHKINYLKPDYPKIKNVLLWCNFACGKFEQAKDLSEKVLNEKPDIQDFIVAANVYMALNDETAALKLYQKAMIMSPNLDVFFANFRHDSERLLSFGVKKADVDLVFEIALMEKLPVSYVN